MNPMKDQQRKRKPSWLVWLVLLLAAAVAIAAVVGRWLRKRRLVPVPRARLPAPPPIPLTVQGLTEAEAEARRSEGQDNALPFRPRRPMRKVWRENIFTIFNLNLVGLAFAQFLLGLPLDALLSLGMIVLNGALNIGQEMFARVRLRQVEAATRLKATVIREGVVRSIEPNEIVLGDALVAGPGDSLLVDGKVIGGGQIVVDESMLIGRSRRLVKRDGDAVYAGSFCISGRAAYEAQKVGEERLVVTLLAASEAGQEELTSLERIIARVLRILLMVVAVFTALLLFRYFNLEIPIDTKLFADAASVVFGIAPASLFFMIFLTYAAGTADLGRLGALVHRAREVESLAHATTICFAKAGILTGTQVEVEPIEPPEGKAGLAQSRIRQILGDYVRSTSMDNLTTRAMTSAFEGSRRVALEEAPFLAAYGWSGITFDDDDLRGVYILGDPQALEEHLVRDQEPPPETEEERAPLEALRSKLPSLGRFFRRSKQAAEEDAEAETEVDGTKSTTSVEGSDPARPQEQDLLPPGEGSEEPGSDAVLEDEAPKQNLFRRAMSRVRSILPHREPKPEEAAVEEQPEGEETVLLFAYHPNLAPLHGADGLPQVPGRLIPLCTLRYTERVRPEAIETIRAFAATGVRIKIFAAGAPDQITASLRQAGLGAGDGQSVDVISGEELASLDRDQLLEAVDEKTVFGHISPEQARQVVKALRERGQTVAVVGDGVNDVPAMRQANLAIARHSSSQVALSVADIILLKDSPKVLLDVLGKGQRIVNGLLDVLKLYLTQMIYLTLLILAIRLFAQGFPYASKQSTIISVVTVSIPAAGLSLWAVAGVLPTQDLRWLLARFVVPAATAIGVAGFIVYVIFLTRTGDMAYAQLTLTYALVAMGLMLVLFLKPPTRLWAGVSPPSGDWRFAIAVAVLLVAFLFLSWIPLARELFLVDWLRRLQDYAIIGLVVLCWAVSLRIFWWAMAIVARKRQALPVAERQP
jgi:magnesium-transporting ATPase (P-type)